MTRCKMDKPERADYFRVFARHMLVDEDYEHLSREEWGSVFLLMLHQWSKGGTLPADRKKLAHFARCSVNELEGLLEKWPKLEAADETGDRVGIPYLLREWAQVMGFYEIQTKRSALGVAARKPKDEPMGNPRATHGSPSGLPVGLPVGLPNQDQDKDKEVPPVVPQGGPGPMGSSGKRKRERKIKSDSLAPFSPWVKEVLEAVVPTWPREDGPETDRRTIAVSVPETGHRLEEILVAHPTLPAELVIASVARYLAENRQRFKAPQYYFGPEGPWKGFIRSEMTAREEKAKREAKAQAPAPAPEPEGELAHV